MSTTFWIGYRALHAAARPSPSATSSAIVAPTFRISPVLDGDCLRPGDSNTERDDDRRGDPAKNADLNAGIAASRTPRARANGTCSWSGASGT